MSLVSMTGFARHSASFEETSWTWELRTVNAKGMDVKLRLPSGFETLEKPARDLIASDVSRGNCHVTLSVEANVKEADIRLNIELISSLYDQLSKLAEEKNAPAVKLENLLSVRGVIETMDKDTDEQEQSTLHKAMLESLKSAVQALISMRRTEGQALQKTLSDQLDHMAAIVDTVEADPSRSQSAIQQKIKQQVEALFEADNRLEQDRLHQEAVLLATKVDLCEELDRLKTHIEAARQLLKSDKPVGRKLEFLSQEFNREANTLCSKSNAVSITRSGLELKSVIDQFREQVANIE
jgi:uncharacterized protein (TIGR00255 family)